jgi:Glycosyltransferase family 87
LAAVHVRLRRLPALQGKSSRLPILAARWLVISSLAALFLVQFGGQIQDTIDAVEARSRTKLWEGNGDFITFYAAGDMVLDGQGNQVYDVERVSEREEEIYPEGQGVVEPFFNPPFVTGLFALFALVPHGAAFIAWTIVSLGALAAALVILDRLMRDLPAASRLLFHLGALSWLPVHRSLQLGQLSLLLVLCWAVAALFLMRAQEGKAGASLGVLLLKPQHLVAPVLVLGLAKRWRLLAGLAVVALILGLTALPLVGPGPIVSYPDLLLDSLGWENENGVYQGKLFGWNGFFYLALDGHRVAASALALVAGAATLALAFFAWRQPDSQKSGGLGLAAIVVASLLVSPHLYRQDLSVLIVPAALGLCCTSGWWRGVVGAALVGLWLLGWAVFDPPLDGAGDALLSPESLSFNWFVPGMAAFLVLLVLAAYRPLLGEKEPERADPAAATRIRSTTC